MMKVDFIEFAEDTLMYELMDPDVDYKKFKLDILDYDNTVELLLRNPKSFCRFGDGEIKIMEGNDILFQKYDKRLADMLVNILKNDSEYCYVGIN